MEPSWSLITNIVKIPVILIAKFDFGYGVVLKYPIEPRTKATKVTKNLWPKSKLNSKELENSGSLNGCPVQLNLPQTNNHQIGIRSNKTKNSATTLKTLSEAQVA